jgi:SAM-dependent methyltransferase
VGETAIELSAGHGSGGELVERLRAQRAAFEARPAVRSLYRDWHSMIVDRLAAVTGETIELGSGFGAFAEHHPAAIATDVVPTPWAERAVDAEALPFDDGSVANLVMTDVIHHLPHPPRLFGEAERVLRTGGRLIAVEPYCSQVSGFAYRHFHREGADPDVDPLADAALSSTDPLDANNAVVSLIFWRGLERFRELWPRLRVAERRRFSVLASPVSGGLEGRRLAPDLVVRGLARLEPLLAPLAPLAAFRCLIVLERR